MSLGRCARRVVTATLTALDGQVFVGRNDCNAPQPTCPRAGMPRYTGYTLCRTICLQIGHAEDVALRLAGAKARGATLKVEGIDHICDPCKGAARIAGIARLYVADQEVSL